MFEARTSENNTTYLSGRLDASQVPAAAAVLEKITTSTVIDFTDLEYISSAGIGELLAVLKRLSDSGHSLKLVNLNKHIRDVFGYAGLDKVFVIE